MEVFFTVYRAKSNFPFLFICFTKDNKTETNVGNKCALQRTGQKLQVAVAAHC